MLSGITETEPQVGGAEAENLHDEMRIGRKRLTQVFKYLEALNQHRNPATRQIDEQPWVLWLRDLPDHPAILRATLTHDEDGTPVPATSDWLLRVRRPSTTLPPTPPAELREWLVSGWEDPTGSVRVRGTRNEFDEHGETKVTRFDDDVARPEALKDWQSTWEEWAANERPARAAMAVFERFYELYGRMQREAERLELMIGDGLLSWRRDDGSVHHPVILLRVQLEFDPTVPEFRVVEIDRGPELYSSLFHSMPDVDGRIITGLRSELEAGGFHPLGSEDTSGFLRSLAVRLSPRGHFEEDDRARSKLDIELSIRRDPLIFLRPRTTGFATAIEAVLHDLTSRADLPESLLHIVGVQVPNDTGAAESAPTDTGDRQETDVLLSKPVNEEQRRIAQRLDRHGGVVVQGPPGTGKTHTIANLIGHLLAQGKSVLVTAQTTKALRVLRDQVVEQLQPLCVAVLESDTESRRQLESAVDAIVRRRSDADAGELDAEAERLADTRDRLRADIQAVRQQLVAARNDEYRDVVVAGQFFAPSDAARYVAQHGSLGWIPGDVRPGEPLPLSDEEVHELYTTNAQISPSDERELCNGLPEPEELLSPDAFEQLARERDELTAADRTSGSEYWTERAVEMPSALEHVAEQRMEAVRHLAADERWRIAAIEAGSEGGPARETWENLCRIIESVRNEAARVAEPLVRYAPTLAEEIPLEEQAGVLGEIITHLDAGGKLNRLTFLLHRAWRRIVESVRVADGRPTSREHFEALRALAKLRLSRGELCQRWDRQMASRDASPAAELGEEPERNCAQYIPMIRECLDWQARVWLPVERALKDAGFDWYRFLSQQPPVAGAHGALRRLRDTVQGPLQGVLVARANGLRWSALEAALVSQQERLRRYVQPARGDGLVDMLFDAVVRMDSGAYRRSFIQLAQLVAKRKIMERRDTHLGRLATAAPCWADAIRHRQGRHGADVLPGPPTESWLWKQLHDELERRGRTCLQTLQDRLDQLSTELRRVTAELIDRRAWAAQVRRTNLKHQQALVGWLDVVRKIGKGTGKRERVSALRREATRLMNACKGAVPVWIMPLNRVVENFDPRTTRFDVVIIDEASQSDVMALMALYLGRKAVVVGDHEQVSPAAVGQKLDIVQGLITEHLTSIPNAILYDGQLSVYDLARQSFGGTVVLVEHFRCVPEIIEFSNTLCYDGRIRPLREACSAAVKPPTVAYRVEGTRAGKLNPAEATAVASLVAAACDQPEYSGATFGVISLVGDEQTLEIERILRNRLTPQEYERRRLLCGNAAQFQGDERDIVFLSLVDSSPDGKPLPMKDTAVFRQRYNVAASRARDQLWVVHSLDPKVHLKAGDLRRRLIEHATDPTALSQLMAQREVRVESEFEREVMRRLIAEGYDVYPQWQVGHFRIDLVVVGDGKRLAVECDGDRYHPREKLAEDLERQTILGRLGWTFVRIRGSRFFREPDAAMDPVFLKLRALGIPPRGESQTSLGRSSSASEEVEAVIRRAAEIRALWGEESPAVAGLAVTARARRGRGQRWQQPLLRHLGGDRDIPGNGEALSACASCEDSSGKPDQQTLAGSAARPRATLESPVRPRA